MNLTARCCYKEVFDEALSVSFYCSSIVFHESFLCIVSCIRCSPCCVKFAFPVYSHWYEFVGATQNLCIILNLYKPKQVQMKIKKIYYTLLWAGNVHNACLHFPAFYFSEECGLKRVKPCCGFHMVLCRTVWWFSDVCGSLSHTSASSLSLSVAVSLALLFPQILQ